MEEHQMIKKIPIGALQPGYGTVMIVALVISKSDPRRIWDGKERWVTTLTLRDSTKDIINFTVWGSREEALRLRDDFHVGEVVEVVRPKIVEKNDRSSGYCPQVTSWLELKYQEGKTQLSRHLGNWTPYMKIFSLPTKAASAFLSISDILNNSGSLKGHYVDILAAVRSVGQVKNLPSREGDLEGERRTREVRLFDYSGDTLVLKLWDLEQIRMSSEWIPRENVLFIADVRIDFDTWKNIYVISTTSKTIITVNPETQEAINLAKYAQTVDLSANTKMDQFISTVDLRFVDKIVNISTLKKMMRRRNDKDQLMIVNIYGFITRLDLDCPEAVTMKCGRCSGSLKPNVDGQRLCINLECSDYQNIDVVPSYEYSVRADISDETGTLPSLKVYQSLLVEKFGPASEFLAVSHNTKSQFKWQLVMTTLRLSLAVMLTTGGKRTSHSVIVATVPVSVKELTIKMPNPTVM